MPAAHTSGRGGTPPTRALVLLRGLYRRAHSDQEPLDDLETIAIATADAGLPAGSVETVTLSRRGRRRLVWQSSPSGRSKT